MPDEIFLRNGRRRVGLVEHEAVADRASLESRPDMALAASWTLVFQSPEFERH